MPGVREVPGGQGPAGAKLCPSPWCPVGSSWDVGRAFPPACGLLGRSSGVGRGREEAEVNPDHASLQLEPTASAALASVARP